MTYALGIVGLIIAVLILVWVALSQRHRHLNPRLQTRRVRLAPSEQLQQLRMAGTYRGVRIEAHCSAASRLSGHDFSFDEAPELPASGCDAAVCECAYIGLPERRRLGDRRSGRDRRQGLRLDTADRRSDRPRRKRDVDDWVSAVRLSQAPRP
jgi:hypothetical protein